MLTCQLNCRWYLFNIPWFVEATRTYSINVKHEIFQQLQNNFNLLLTWESLMSGSTSWDSTLNIYPDERSFPITVATGSWWDLYLCIEIGDRGLFQAGCWRASFFTQNWACCVGRCYHVASKRYLLLPYVKLQWPYSIQQYVKHQGFTIALFGLFQNQTKHIAILGSATRFLI